MQKNTYLEVSILLSIISIAITVFINYQIANAYLRSYGKTRALFGLTELLQFGYQYYVLIPGIISLALVILSFRDTGLKGKNIAAFGLSLFTITIVFLKAWRLFV